MKKLLAAIFVIALLFAAAVSAAEPNTASDANSQSDATISTTDNSSTTVNNPPQYITPTKLDGSFVAPPQLYYDPRMSESIPEDALPEIYRIEGWKIFYSAPYNNGVKIKRIKAERKAWISDQESATGERVMSDAKAIRNSDILVPLPYYPEGANEVSTSKVFMGNEEYIVNQVVSEAWYHAWKKSGGAKYYIILYNSRLVSVARVKAIGSAMVGGITIGPNPTANPVVGAGGGMGFGTAKTHIFKEPTFMVIAFSNKGEIPQRLLKKAEPPKELTLVKEEVKKEEARVEIREEIIFPMVEFELNKFKLITERQKKPIRAAAKKTAENWEKMKKEGLYVMIVGSCSPEGTANYNDVLGRKRAEEIYKLFSTILIDVYGLPDEEVKERVKFLSAGKNNYPEFEEITKQRNAAFFIAAKIKVRKE